MKKFFINIGSVLISLTITFFTFECLSWYHFGDIPTKVVLIRLIAFFFVTHCLIIGILYLLSKRKKSC